MSLSPMMKQYFAIKEQYIDTIVLFRLGDFYEMFFDDAITASRELELTLTGRDCGLEERAPMCGVPHHAVDAYMAKLIQKGFKVAVCEQLTEPAQGKIVEREVVRVVTAGTVTESAMLDEDKNNYLMSIYYSDGCAGVSWTDITTGEFSHAYIAAPAAQGLNNILSRISPSEIICNNSALELSLELSVVKFGSVCPFTLFNDAAFEDRQALSELKIQLPESAVKMLTQKKLCLNSAGGLMAYIKETQKRAPEHINNVRFDDEESVVLIDDIARKTLELTKNSKDGGASGTLFGLLNKVSTHMGRRYLRKLIEQPSRNPAVINARLEAVDELLNSIMRDKLCDLLDKVRDIERLSSKISRGDIKPKECLALAGSLAVLPEIKNVLDGSRSALLNEINSNIGVFTNAAELILSAIVDVDEINDGAAGTGREKSKGAEIIKKGFDKTLDDYIDFSKNINDILIALETNEKNETGIKGLKVAYNRVFGYYIEVPKSQINLVPYRYTRKQTVATGERYITDELKGIEEKMLTATEQRQKREQELYDLIIKELKKYVDGMLATGKTVAYLDCLAAFAAVAQEYDYVRPAIDGSIKHIKIAEGRHCIVERTIKNEKFVPNDTYLNNDSDRIMVITGPNMAGKSVYMRQVALIVILAHIGSFVPAKSAEIPLIDRIFTRVGASDDLATGRSTFMVEMSEMANILQNATDDSLILLDEVGRGTSTYDGLSIAWSIIEYLAENITAKTLFSTHYHEITELEGVIDGVKNYKLTLRELNGSIIFLRKLMRGSANRSFGIEVAGLAGLPEDILVRAKGVLKLLENADINRQSKMTGASQISMFSSPSAQNEVAAIIKDIDTDNLTPRHALDILIDLKEKVLKNG